jgi:hypothetical protein
MNTQNNKTGRKNKTNINVSYPTDKYFTIAELINSNVDCKAITLRVRLKKMVESGEVVELGTKHMPKGRPVLIFAKSPVSQTVLDAAKKDEVTLHDSLKVLVTTISDPVSTSATNMTVNQ